MSNLISLEQSAKVIGVPDYTLRRGLAEGMTTLSERRTSGKHGRFDLDHLLEHHEEIVEELRERHERGRQFYVDNPDVPKPPWWGKEWKFDPKGAEELRAVLRTTIDADSAAIRLGVSRPTLRRWEREGKIVGIRPLGPKQVRYYTESIDALVEAGTIV